MPQDIIAVRNDDGSYSDHLRYIAQYAGLVGMAVRPSKEIDAFNGTINTPNGIYPQNVCVVLFGCSGAVLGRDGMGVNSDGRENVRPAVMFHVRNLEPLSHSEVEGQFKMTPDPVDDALGCIERAPRTMYACTCEYTARVSSDESVLALRLVHSICCIDYNRHTHNGRYSYNGACDSWTMHREVLPWTLRWVEDLDEEYVYDPEAPWRAHAAFMRAGISYYVRHWENHIRDEKKTAQRTHS